MTAAKATSTKQKPGSTEGEKPLQITVDEKNPKGEVKHLHFREDGFTSMGRVWYRGEELKIDTGSPEYEQTKDSTGASWTDLTEQEQYAKYGKIMFASGPWIGKSILDPEVLEGLEPEDVEELKRRAAARK